MRNDFDNKKKMEMKKISKQKLDPFITPFLEKINKLKDYFTTSSCSGRIVLLKNGRRKNECGFVLKSHDEVSSTLVWSKLKKLESESWFRFEGLILHVACRNLEAAFRLLNLARKLGWKRSGIISGKKAFVVEIYSTRKIDVLIAKNEPQLHRDYVDFLSYRANQMLREEHSKISELEASLTCLGVKRWAKKC